MAARRRVRPTPWSHEGLEQRGYKKCPYCWRHLVKIEDHVAAHKEGRMGPDGKRLDRGLAQQHRWAERYDGSPATEAYPRRQVFAPRAVLERILRLPPVNMEAFAKDVDEAVDQGT